MDSKTTPIVPNFDDFQERVRQLTESMRYASASPSYKVEMVTEFFSQLGIGRPRSPSTLRETIESLLMRDAQVRKPGNHGVVYGIADLKRHQKLGHGIPILRNKYTTPVDRVASDEEFKERLEKHAPFFAGFDFRRHGILLAGGAASGILMRKNKSYDDYDCFLVGHKTDASALRSITELGNHLWRWHRDQWSPALIREHDAARHYNMRVCRTKGCVTFVLPTPDSVFAPVQIQLILRHYSYGCEVIRGFDMGSCSVAWDGESVMMTELGKFAAEHSANILNLAVRRKSYERRLGRYFARGYDLVLPNFKKTDYIHLPYLSIHGFEKTICGCTCEMQASSIGARARDDPSTTETKAGTDTNDDPSERSSYDPTSVDYSSVPSISLSNANALMRALRTNGEQHVDRWMCTVEIYTPNMSLAGTMPFVDEAMWLTSIRSTLLGPVISVWKLQNLVGTQVAIEIIHTILIKGFEGRVPTIEELAPICRAHLQKLQSMIIPVPIIFRGTTDETSMSGDSTIKEDEWYGENHENHEN